MKDLDPGLLINKLAHAINVKLDRRLREHGVTLSQWKILIYLWHNEGCSQAEIQDWLGIEAATVTGLIQRMTSQNLIKRQSDPADRRVQRVFLTENGRALEPIVDTLISDIGIDILKGFTVDEQEFFMRLLKRALINVERS